MNMKRLLSAGVACLMPLMLLLSMLLPLCTVSYGPYTRTENGFGLLDFKGLFITSDFEWANYVLGFLSLILLLVAIVCLVANAATAVFFSEERTKFIQKITVRECLMGAVFYTVAGIVYAVVNSATYHGPENFMTWAFFSLLLVGFAVVVHIVWERMFADRF